MVVGESDYGCRDPQRGEMVAARPASLGGRAVVKRVAGLPHERVQAGEREWTLDEGQFFLLGDQETHSVDSRVFGPVTREELIGPVRLRLWPWKWFPHCRVRQGVRSADRSAGPTEACLRLTDFLARP